MGGGKKSKAPAAPDYAAAAQAQGAADKATAQYTTALDRPDQVGPQGSVSWTLKPGADPNNPKPGDWVQTTAFTPEQQAIFDAQQQNDLALQGLGSTAIGQAQNVMGNEFNPNLTDFKPAEGLGQSATGLPQNTLNGMQGIDENVDRYNAEAAQALYDKNTQFYDDRFAKDEAAERQRLAAMGLTEGSAAYNNAMQDFNRNKNEAYATASMNSLLYGYDVGTQNLNNQLNTRNSNMNLAQGQFGQDATRTNMDLAERQAQATSQLNLANQAAAQRQQQFSEQAYQRSLPINEISALLSGGGVSAPQFANFAPSTPFNAPDTLGATQAQYNAAMGQYNASQQQKAGLLGAGAQLGGSYLGSK